MEEYTLNEPSEEQLNIINALSHSNVIVDSVAGSGKTTTVLHIAKHYQDKKILLFTYNRKLNNETKEKISKLGIVNLHTYTYNSYGYKHIKSDIRYKCDTSEGLISFIENNDIDIEVDNYDIVILDECQDLTNILFKFVTRCLEKISNYILCIIGDQNQCIYKFNSADKRYITMADQLYSNNKSWIRLSLSMSYRISNQIAHFTNFVLGEDRMKANKNSSKVIYKVSIKRDFGNFVVSRIKSYLRRGYLPDDIFILSPSIKSTVINVSLVSNALTKNNIDVYIPLNDDSKIDDEISNKKITFSTFHQAKGLERKIVFILSFDSSYFKYFNKAANPNSCPNELYVAITRASDHLILLQDLDCDPLIFIDLDKLPDVAECKEKDYLLNNKRKIKSRAVNKITTKGVTDLIKYQKSIVISRISSILKYEEFKEDKLIRIPLKQRVEDKVEEVSSINSHAISSFYNIIKCEDNTLLSECKKMLMNNKLEYAEDAYETIVKCNSIINTTNNEKELCSNLLEMSNNYLSIRDKVNFKTRQINKYDWLKFNDLQTAYHRIDKYIQDKDIKFEGRVEYSGLINVVGFIDAISHSKIIEFKAVQKIKIEHILQIVIYTYMWNNTNENKITQVEIFNILNNKIYKIEYDYNIYETIFRLLICSNIHETAELNNENFILFSKENYYNFDLCEKCKSYYSSNNGF